MLNVTSTDGVRIAVDESGTGDSMVLVHGVLSDHTRWEPVRNLISGYFTVYTMDRRGHGESSDAQDYNLGREVEDIKCVVESLRNRVHLVGHSFGAVCAIEAALELDSLSTLALYEPPIVPSSPRGHPYPPDVIREIKDQSDDNSPERIVEIFYRRIGGYTEDELEKAKQTPEWSTRIAAAHTLIREVTALERFDFEPSDYRSLSVPTCLIHGSETAEERLEILDLLEGAIPTCEKYRLDGEGHVAMATGPKVLGSAIMDFALTRSD